MSRKTLSDPTLAERLRRVELVAFDVDGTLTDGAVVYVGDPAEEAQRFDVRDGFGLAQLARAGLAVVWISGRGSAATERRAAELGATRVRLGVGPKHEVLAELQDELGVGPDATCAMGDDLPDLRLFQRAAVCVCPADAAPEVREVADLVTESAGGRGAARELCEAILRAKGVWDDLVASFVGEPARGSAQGSPR